MISLQLCLLSSLAAVVSNVPYIHTSLPPLCQHRGKYYTIGEHFSPTPCEKCFCEKPGSPVCLAIDCSAAMCVDAVTLPGQCCPTCPNGLNCKHGDVIIKMGEVYHPDPATSCQCNFGRQYLGFGKVEVTANCTSA